MAAASAVDKRRLLADLATSRRGRGSFLGPTASALAVGVSVILLILWFAGWFSTPRSVREVRALVDEQIAMLGRVARNEVPLTEVSVTPLDDLIRDVPREHQGQVRGEIERLVAARKTAEIDSYFALPPQQRRAELDRRIRAEEERRKAREASRDGGSAAGRGSKGSTNGGHGPQPTVARSQPPRRPRTEEERNLRRKASIDRTTPEQRARRAEYRRVMQERREQLAGSAGR